MSGNQEVREQLERIRQDQADNDFMLQAYGRYWLPVATRIAEALEKIERHLAARKDGDDAK